MDQMKRKCNPETTKNYLFFLFATEQIKSKQFKKLLLSKKNRNEI